MLLIIIILSSENFYVINVCNYTLYIITLYDIHTLCAPDKLDIVDQQNVYQKAKR